jgi:hypothetical protein
MAKNTSDLSLDARKALRRWTADDFYIEIRPFTSTYLRPTEPHNVDWSVTVEFRSTDRQVWTDSGRKLDDVILRLAPKIPRRRKLQPGYEPATNRGKNNLLALTPTAPLGLDDAKHLMKRKAKEESEPKKKRKKKKS